MNGTSNTTSRRALFAGLLAAFATLSIITMLTAAPMGFMHGTHDARALPGKGSQAKAARMLPDEPPVEQKLSGPYTYKNLTIFLVHGPDRIVGKQYMTLQEALKKKLVVVYETGDVNELAIRNKSNREIFIQAGDIVKGGRQDRVLGNDLVLAPHSKKIAIPAYCVEQGRWSGRDGESDQAFNSSDNQVVGRKLKLAAKFDNDQSKVWSQVEETQNKLSQNLGGSVRSEQSESSLELALRNDKVAGSVEEYVKALEGIVAGHDDVIGYVFAINGSVNSADVYASRDLFTKFWTKLLRASAAEAIADYDHEAEFAQPTADSVRATLSEAEKGDLRDTRNVDESTVTTQESKDNVMFETRDRKAGDVWLHRSYLKK